jgi:hypothetical protein
MPGRSSRERTRRRERAGVDSLATDCGGDVAAALAVWPWIVAMYKNHQKKIVQNRRAGTLAPVAFRRGVD